MALTEEQQKRREGKVTASFAPYLMAADRDRIYKEWQRLVGDPAYQPDDLSEVWPVQLGNYLESFALDWHQHKTGKVLSGRGMFVKHPHLPYVGATLDAYRADDSTVIDCKVIGRWRKLEDACPFYTPQMIVQAGCMETRKAALLVVHGGDEPVEMAMEWDVAYEKEVWDRIEWFQRCVESLTPPVELVAAPPPAEAVKVYDMTGSNEWGYHAAEWLETWKASKRNKLATDKLKTLFPLDGKQATGHGVTATRAKNGAVTVKESKE